MAWKYDVGQRVYIRTANGAHRPPSSEAKGSYGVVAPQCTADWLINSNSPYAAKDRTYYVTIESGETELMGEEWLAAAPPGDIPQRAGTEPPAR